MNFDIDCLRTFLIIADTMSFSRAAESVGRTQSTVSQQINKLEAQVGKSVLERRKGRVLELTSEGTKLVQYARRILQLNDEAFGSMSDAALTSFVKLGVPLDFFGRDFTAWLTAFKRSHPMVGLEVEANQSENLLKRTERSEFDLAFFKQDAGASHGTVVLKEQLVWVSGPSFVPEREGSLPLILFPEGCAYRRSAQTAMKREGRTWHRSFVGPSFECLRAATIEGMGATVLARALVEAPLRVLGPRSGLPPLPSVEVVYAYGRRANSRVVSELALFLADCLSNSGVSRPPQRPLQLSRARNTAARL
ncbi:LysR substrate-binding domain-containing protein [Afipia sp. 1NLS2]|uniref:LysR substrate-binding domain-containing protein n=1 Tax=Afipia sp. 1NLS2 TaxID=666684 RepID=UPI0001DA0AAC|nr:LysR substrate-binding domain-containing protein [Afipia sp. 1NLS2]EFI53277.1 transcriptional regulator, LysR family [Afipia sp. 1NLS2]